MRYRPERAEVLSALTNGKYFERYDSRLDWVWGCRIAAERRAWLGLLWLTGLRQSSLIGVEPRQFIQAGDSIMIKGLPWRKKNHSRLFHDVMIPVTDDTLPFLEFIDAWKCAQEKRGSHLPMFADRTRQWSYAVIRKVSKDWRLSVKEVYKNKMDGG